MRKTLFRRGCIECWVFDTDWKDVFGRYLQPRFERQDWGWHDGRSLHKRFLRLGKYVFALSWFTGYKGSGLGGRI